MSTTYNGFNVIPGMSIWAEQATAYKSEYLTFISDLAADVILHAAEVRVAELVAHWSDGYNESHQP